MTHTSRVRRHALTTKHGVRGLFAILASLAMLLALAAPAYAAKYRFTKVADSARDDFNPNSFTCASINNRGDIAFRAGRTSSDGLNSFDGIYRANADGSLTTIAEDPDRTRFGFIGNFPSMNDLGDVYRAADIYLHHSRIGETFGNTLVEAAQAGCLVVCGLDLDWDCAPLETLDLDVHLVRSRRALIRDPSVILARLAEHRTAAVRPAPTVADFAAEIVRCADASRIPWVPAPSLRSALGRLRAGATTNTRVNGQAAAMYTVAVDIGGTFTDVVAIDDTSLDAAERIVLRVDAAKAALGRARGSPAAVGVPRGRLPRGGARAGQRSISRS